LRKPRRKEIARRFAISEKTGMESAFNNVFEKLDVHSRTQEALQAFVRHRAQAEPDSLKY